MEDSIRSLIADNIVSIKPLADGNFSNGFIILGEKDTYFMRKFKHNVHGYEYAHDEKWSFENSHYMMQLFGHEIKSYGTFSFEDHMYHIQDYFDGKPLSLDQLDANIIKSIATAIAHLHVIGKDKVKELDDEKKQRLYARSLREYVTNFEGILPLFESSLEKEPFFAEYFPRVWSQVFTCVQLGNYNRITALHGDFRFGNILYNSDNKQVHFVDFSITPFGEPGIDIGRFIADFELRSLFGNKEKLLEYKNIFLDTYTAITGDKEITKYFTLISQLKGLKLLSPLVQRFLQRDEEQKSVVKRRLLEIDK